MLTFEYIERTRCYGFRKKHNFNNLFSELDHIDCYSCTEDLPGKFNSEEMISEMEFNSFIVKMRAYNNKVYIESPIFDEVISFNFLNDFLDCLKFFVLRSRDKTTIFYHMSRNETWKNAGIMKFIREELKKIK